MPTAPAASSSEKNREKPEVTYAKLHSRAGGWGGEISRAAGGWGGRDQHALKRGGDGWLQSGGGGTVERQGQQRSGSRAFRMPRYARSVSLLLLGPGRTHAGPTNRRWHSLADAARRQVQVALCGALVQHGRSDGGDRYAENDLRDREAA